MSGGRRLALREVGAPLLHLPDGPVDEAATWQPIRCGGGIVMPGPLRSVPLAQVCPSCRTAPRDRS